jgi:sigma-B regulation protein RsbU (phosphoserine phosphatase)
VGKGVTAALFMAIIRSLFRALFQQYYIESEPATASPVDGRTAPFPFVDREALVKAVRLTNTYLIANHGDAYPFATLFAGVLDPYNGRLLYVNAGHNPPLVFGSHRRKGRELRELLNPTGPAVGLMFNATFELGETTLGPGDLLFAFTDGLTEARNPDSEEFGENRLENLIMACEGSAEEMLSTIESAVHEHIGTADAFDDLTMLALGRAA